MQIKIQLTHAELTTAVVHWLTENKRMSHVDPSTRNYELELDGDECTGDGVCQLVIELGDQSD